MATARLTSKQMSLAALPLGVNRAYPDLAATHTEARCEGPKGSGLYTPAAGPWSCRLFVRELASVTKLAFARPLEIVAHTTAAAAAAFAPILALAIGREGSSFSAHRLPIAATEVPLALALVR